jgi:uncharacterized membrane protein
MLFVFFAHFVEAYFRPNNLATEATYVVTHFASPAFVSISGVMLGILFCTRRGSFESTKSSFIRRGIFLLTIGRLLIILAHYPLVANWQETLKWGFMTDAIGFCIILGPLMMERFDQRARVLMGTLIFGVSWLVIIYWTPAATSLEVLKETFFGTAYAMPRVYTDVFPVFPWFGFFLVATSVGEYLGKLIVNTGQDSLAGLTARIGLISIGAGGGLYGTRIILESAIGGSLGTNAHMMLSPLLKLPPSPVYFLVYGGCAFVMLSLLIRFQSNRATAQYSALAEVLGRNSLFVFILQYFVYFTIFPLAGFGFTTLWPLYFILSAVGIWGLALLWDRSKMNRFLTIPGFGSTRSLVSNH